ncbi:MAG TPA: uracil-DNA glycosylase [Usitatibacteraceae bacterium]
MRFDEDYLRELELWPMFALKGADAAPAQAAHPAPHEAGVQAVDAAARRPAAAAVPRPAPVQAKAAAPAAIADPARAAQIMALDWAGLARETAACTACGLCKQRRQAVLGVGALDAPWLFVGEGPGADEDAQGEPFVGQAGKLLDAMLAAAGLSRGREVYIANVVKCRPPGNRTPSLEEAQACAPFLDRQIDLIQPRLIVALGKTAVMRLTGSDASMASLRGKLHRYRDIPVIATYHPAYLLRNLPEKLKAWEDLVLARKAMAALVAGS